MKGTILLITFSVFSLLAQAYDERLMVNVRKVASLLNRAESVGKTPSGEICKVEIRRIEDGYYTLLSESDENSLFVGLDIESYGPIESSWTKRSFTLEQKGPEGSLKLIMKEDFSTKKLIVNSSNMYKRTSSDMVQKRIFCLLPLKS